MFKRFLLWLLLTVVMIVLLRILPFTFSLLSPLANAIASGDSLYHLFNWPMTAETYGDMEAFCLLVLYAIPSGFIALWLTHVLKKKFR